MKNPLARFWQAGSFFAGLLIGVAIMIPLFAMMVTDPGDWQMVWFFGALIVFALGLELQAVITIKPRHRRAIAAKLELLPVRFMELKLEQ